MRLNRYLAQAGFGSRRAVESLVAQGAVTINGQPVDHPGRAVDEANDRVEVNGRPIKPPETHVYIMLNKPRGYDVTRGGEQHHRRAWDLLPAGTHPSVQSVGRLDRDSTGLLLFTNDGDLAFRLTHPSYGCQKVYEVEVDGRISPGALDQLQRGVELEDGPAHAVSVEPLGSAGGRTMLRIVMTEGRKRIVRRMCDAIGHAVVTLNRTALGELTLAGLGRGKTRPLDPGEVRRLRVSVGLPPPVKKTEPQDRKPARPRGDSKKNPAPRGRRETKPREETKKKFGPQTRPGAKPRTDSPRNPRRPRGRS